jgi:hypothetical protein
VTEILKISEDELQSVVIELAQTLKWRVAHFRSVPVKHGDRVAYETPVQADGAGWPDLVLCRDRLIVAELKSETGRLSVPQQDWIFALTHAGVETHVWFPYHWESGEIEETLRKKAIGA